MVLRPLLGLLGTACVVGACVSDNSNTQGTLDGPCFTNGTCNTGLTCQVVSGSARCEVADASVADAPADSPLVDSNVGDAPADQTSTDASDGGCTLQPTLPCNTPCGPNNACCTDTATCIPNTGTCSGGSNAWQCQTRADCSGGSAPCCIGAAAVNLTTCPPTYQWSIGSYCSASCNSAELCVLDSDCFTSVKHHCQTVYLTAISKYVGFCMP